MDFFRFVGWFEFISSELKDFSSLRLAISLIAFLPGELSWPGVSPESSIL
jgi:hypothetical protein